MLGTGLVDDCVVWLVAGYELEFKSWPRERCRELLVHVVKSPFIEQVGFQTVQTFGPMSHFH
jgi:hypothetical protein